MTPAKKPGIRRTVWGYLLCCSLVPLYVNLFPLWKFVSTKFGSSGDTVFTFLPALVLALFLILCWVILRLTRKENGPIDNGALFGGVMLCTIGLLLPDAAFPAKRIHVAEYAALSLIARFSMSASLSGRVLFFYSCCFAAVLGIHDEFLQGLHPARTYGVRDMAVNALGSFGGGLIWHGFNLFSFPVRQRAADTKSRVNRLYLGWLFVSLLMLIWPAYYFKGQPIPVWTVLPLLAAVLCYFVYRNQFSPRSAHGIAALTAASGALAVYPALSKLPGVVFY